MTQRTLELLEQLIAGHQMTPDDLDDLLNNQIPEGPFLDYKHGNELEKKRPSETIRQYLSGFANSEGGILIVGVDEASWSVTGCSAPGGKDLAEWAASCVTPIASHFSPLPRFQVVEHSEGKVLVAFAGRSLNYVPCIKTGRLVYYLRFHDQTLEAPDYLISDLMLGRRQHPYLHITGAFLASLYRQDGPQGSGVMDLCFQPVFQCENQSLSWAESVRLGIICWDKYPLSNGSLLSSQLLSHVEAQRPDSQKYSGRCELTHTYKTARASGMGPFDVVQFKDLLDHTIPIRVHYHFHTPYIWKAAMYILAKGSPPIWHQLSIKVDSTVLQLIDDLVNERGLPGISRFDLLQIQRLSVERPVVAWKGFQ